jgi:zinc transport system substrate-binding protein
VRYALLISGWLAAACFAAESKPRVVTSFLPLYCWTANVAGDIAQVENLLPSRADAHDYAFTPGDARKLGAARLVIVNGLGMEDWLSKWQRGSRDAEQKLVTVSSIVDRDQLITGNPHLWLDPMLACGAVSNIAVALGRVDPGNASVYSRNAAAYVATLQKLDRDIRDGLADVTNRAIVTYHDAFPYFAKRYGLEIVAVVERVPGVNPTGRELTHLSQIIRGRNVRAIFVPPNSSSRIARRISEDLRVPLAELDTIEAGELKPDTYERAMRANLKSLQKVLR